MKKIALSVAFMMLLQLAFAGGILTNYNQSAQYIRMMSRNASLDVDAVFYNPAGLVKLNDGWHFSFSSQTIWQDRNIQSSFPLLNSKDYKGETFAPIFPDFYGVYKKDKWAFSIGVAPVGGGGTAEFKTGLPAFEIPISQTKTLLSSLGVSGYDVDLYFNGSSIIWGIQLGATYAINDKLSVYGGVRWMPAKNVYDGYIKNIQLQVDGNMLSAAAFLTGASANIQALADMPTTLSPYLAAAGGYTLAQLEGAGQITAAMKTGIETGLQLMGLPQGTIDAMTLNQINGAYVAASPTFQGQANQLAATADKMGDKIVSTEQTGNGFIPMFGLNYSPNEDWNFAVKYEMKTRLTLDNKPNADNNYDLWGSKVNSDIPAILAIGVGYSGLDWLEAQLSYNLYFDKGVDWGNNVNDIAVFNEDAPMPIEIKHREIDNNYYELALGLQFNLSESFSVSVGGLKSKTGVADSWQNDLSYSNESYTLGGGILWKITDKIQLDLGVSNTIYKDDLVSFNYPGYPDLSDSPITSYENNYGKTTLSLAAGLTFSIF